MNEIFKKLLDSKIDNFIYAYKNLSRDVFVNESGNLIHPGEFGMYREKIVCELLKPFLPSKLGVGTGFIITSKNHISTQCDIIIYDKESTPVIENGEQRFFPVESVVGVVEVKSKLSKSDFKEALVKLANIKVLREDIGPKNPYIFKDGSYVGFNTKLNVMDQMATFLICESLEFKSDSDLDQFFADTYKDIDSSLYHNMILSLNDGIYLYHDTEKSIYLSYWKRGNLHRNIVEKPNGYDTKRHITLFVDYFYMLISSVSVLFIEITNYLWGRD